MDLLDAEFAEQLEEAAASVGFLLIHTRLTEREHCYRKARRNHRGPHKVLLETLFNEFAKPLYHERLKIILRLQIPNHPALLLSVASRETRTRLSSPAAKIDRLALPNA